MTLKGFIGLGMGRIWRAGRGMLWLLAWAIGSMAMGAQGETAWENSLGMRFVEVPGGVMFCTWETRLKDFKAFVEDSGYKVAKGMYVSDPAADKTEQREDRDWRNPGFVQTPDHPVVGVSWDDARAFCRWLTRREQAMGLLQTNQHYRLPTDVEWSRAAGLTNEAGATPQERFLGVKDVYPWGGPWPPTAGAGNYAAGLQVDPFDRTAPVGSFQTNVFGLFDLGGNVAEWCEDWWNGDRKFRVLRGASWQLDCHLCLMTSYRFPNLQDMRMDTYGFRVVLDPPPGRAGQGMM